MESGATPRRHSGPWPAQTQPTARKRATDSVGGPSRNIEVSRGTLAFDLADFAAVASVLTDSPLAVVSESEALVYTGSEHEEGYESVRVLTVLVGESPDFIDFDIRTQEPDAQVGHLSKELTSPLMLAVVRAGQRLTVTAMKRENSSLVRDGDTMEFTLLTQ